MTTLAGPLAGRDNALNFVRLVLASMVVFSHTPPIAYATPSPSWGEKPIGEWAVAGFFAISGYLIAGSRDRLAFGPFIWRRGLRIMPAFWTALILVAFVFAPMSAPGSWQAMSSVTYVTKNGLLRIFQWGIDGTPPGAWNGSLWTLFYEFGAYVALGILFYAKPLRRPIPLATLMIACVAIYQLAGPLHITTNLYLHAMWLGSFFLAGALLWSLRDHIKPSWWGCAVALVLLVIAAFLSKFLVFGQLPLAYLVLSAGVLLPIRIGATNDISYGMYVYAFPVQVALGLGAFQWLGYWGFSVVSLVLTTPLAAASWFWVERPAMKLRRIVAGAAPQVLESTSGVAAQR